MEMVDCFDFETETSSDSEKQTGRFLCHLCNVHIQENYREKHLVSKLHRSKLKKTEGTPALTGEQKYCLPCNTICSNDVFYKCHLGSKKHRRNVVSENASDTSSINLKRNFLPMALKFDDEASPGESCFNRKKYRRRPHSEEEPFHQDYVQLLTTYLSLRLALDPNVKDFNISMDDKRWHTFGDIVIDVKYKNRSTVYAIKCKRVYEFPKTIDSFDQSRIRMEKEYESLTVLRNLQEFSNARFLIFSTCNTSPKFSETDTTVGVSRQVLNLWRTEQGILPDTDYLIVKPSKRNDLVNVTSDSENIFSIYPETENESFKLPPVFFYTSQIVFPWMIDDLLKKKFEISIKKKYSKYIEEWAEGNLGGNYYLNKRDVIIKVGEILLFPYMMLPKKIITADEKNFEIWNKVMNRVDLIVVERKNHVNGRMCEPLNQMIEEKFGKIDEVSKTITISDEIVKGIEDSRIKAYLFEEYDSTSLKYKISLSKFYKIFWKSGKTPIPLSSEKDPEQDELIVKVISFMKQYGVNLKFLLKTSRPTLSEKTLNIFGCLDDVKELVDLKKVGFTIPGGFVSLDEIRFTDPTILKMITPNQFFDMALGKYSIQKDTLKKGERLNGAMIILDKKTKDLIQESLGLEVKNTGRLEGINPLWF